MRRLVVTVLMPAWFAAAPLWAQAAAQLAPQARAYVSVDSPLVALTHVRVVDGTGAPAAEDQTVVIDHGKIAAVGPAARVSVPRGALVMDLRGKTVIPGIFGMHDHIFYPAGGAGGQRNHHYYSAPRLYLAAGVTSIRTAGTYEPYQDLNLKEQIDRGQAPGPRVNVTGAYIDENRGRVRGPEDARRLVAYWADEGATNFKAYTNLTRAELGAAIDEAHKRGLKVTGHLCSIGFREAVALGIDNLEHGYQTNTEWNPEKKPDECPRGGGGEGAGGGGTGFSLADLDINSEPVQATIRDMVSHHVALTSTLAVFECGVPGRRPPQQRFLDALSVETRESFLRRMAARPGRDPARAAEDSARAVRLFKKSMEFERSFVKAGGQLQEGLDPTGAGCSLFGFGDQRTIELMVESGATPVEAIKYATLNGATFLGQNDRLGSIAPGKLADLVILDGDPSKNIEDIEKVTVVFKDGVGYDSAKLIAAVKGQVGIN